MGGIPVIVSTLVTIVICADMRYGALWIPLGVLMGYAGLGAWDDWCKIRGACPKGISARTKLGGQMAIAIAAVIAIIGVSPGAQGLFFPVSFSLLPSCLSSMGMGIPFVLPISLWLLSVLHVLIITGTSNAVNLTDGLDGLATMPFILTCCVLAGTAWAQQWGAFVHGPHGPWVGECAVMALAAIGAALGFLWYNAPPARIMMGDTGALAWGGFLGTLAVLLRQEVILAIAGGVFVSEALSVMLQVLWFKRTGRRIFRMAPLHHHFEQLGWPETQVTVRFWISSWLLAITAAGLLALGRAP